MAIEPDAPERLLVAEDLVRGVMREEMARFKGGASVRDRSERQAMVVFYEARDWRPVWVNSDGFTLKAKALMAEIRNADDWGLTATSYELPELPSGAPTNAQLAAAEVRLTATLLKYARDARGGRTNPLELSKHLDRQPQLYEPKSIIEETAQAEDPAVYIRSLHPRHPQFEGLRKLYVEARKSNAVAAPAAQKLPEGPRLKIGMSHPQVPLLRKRLAVGKQGGDLEDTYFDEGLASAVREFQIAKGIQPADGQLTMPVRRALNAAAAAQSSTNVAKRLLVNMEQWRWMPDNFGRVHFWVNIPDLQVKLLKDDQIIFSERVIVGRQANPTPIFSDEMEFVIFHPEWGVPDTIKAKELLPYLRTSTSVLHQKNMRVVYNGRVIDPDSVNWNEADPRQFSIIQGAGPGNPLGVVKFRFPNKHDVYMHDTPAKNLFQANARALSYGCIRVQNPVRMAEVILAEDKGWSADRVRSMAAQGAQLNQQVTLSRKLPVHITYFTATVGEDGKAQFRPDIYGHEERISLGIEGKAHLIPQPREDPALIAARPGQGFPGKEARYRPGQGYGPGGPWGGPYSKGGGQGVSNWFSGLFGN